MTIVCEKHGFVFYHIPKTGGSAITWGLAKAIPELPDPPPAEELYSAHGKKHTFYGWQWQYHNDRGRRGGSIIHNTFPKEKSKPLFVFTSYRNPYDRAVSLYKWAYPQHKFRGVHKRNGIWAPQIAFCNPNLVNFQIRFENLNEDFKKVCETIGVEPVDLPIINRHYEPDNYRSLYDENSKKAVEEYYKDDLNLLEYDF